MPLKNALRDEPYLSLERASWHEIEPVSTEMPLRVFQTWETTRFGRTHMMSLQLFRMVNRGLAFHFFDRESRDDFMRVNFADTKYHEIYERSLFGALQADLFRYGCLYKLGGIYFDISKAVFTKPLANFCPAGCTELLTFENTFFDATSQTAGSSKLLRVDRLFAQWALGFAAQHPILEKLILQIGIEFDDLVGKKFSDPKSAILNFSGPRAFTRVIRAYLDTNPDIHLNQIDIDFQGRAVLGIPGAAARYIDFPSYAHVKNAQLFR